MSKLLPLLLLLLLAGAALLAHGMPPISRDYNTHCHCAEVESRVVPPHLLRSLKLLPQDAHCPHTEVIAGLTNGEKICLNPQSSWVRKLVRFVLRRPSIQQDTRA
ncbi:Interleukin-8 [Merluccius polli]|uniref:Interleukin-8 n=1 Tax=Merluccius polli TaxID=89951 RepID=A0AA47LZG3_MERPO|nr:Interleukin-8 [Merluccius polli]